MLERSGYCMSAAAAILIAIEDVRAKSKNRVSRPTSRKPITRDYSDLLAHLPPKKPPAPSLRRRRKRRHATS
jgi:hypothetical protein